MQSPEPTNVPTPPVSAASRWRKSAWSAVWRSAVLEPSTATFEVLTDNPHAGLLRAYGWLFISSLLGSSLFFLAGYARRQADLWLPACGAPTLAVLALPAFAMLSGLAQLLARLLGGKGPYKKLVYAMAAYLAPLTLIAAVVGAILPGIWMIPPLLIMLAYAAGLTALAVKAVHSLTQGQAIVVSVVTFGCVLILAGSVVVAMVLVSQILVVQGV